MAYTIIEEYTSLLKKKSNIESTLATLPQGYISNKVIKGKTYSYLQARVCGRVKSTYLKNDEVKAVEKQLSDRKKSESELSTISVRIAELEKAAKLVDMSLFRRMEQLKLSIGMDELPRGMKQLCVSFSEAMTSIEGIPASSETKKDLNNWIDGSTGFLSAFENTLKRYGFYSEVK